MKIITVEAQTDFKKIKGQMKRTGQWGSDLFTGQSECPSFQLLVETLEVKILDGDMDFVDEQWFDVSEAYKNNKGLIMNAENILANAQFSIEEQQLLIPDEKPLNI